jgi:ribosomal protein S5
MDGSYIHVQSMRLASGEEALLAVVLTRDGRVGYGFDCGLDATAARHMAMRAAGIEVVTAPGAGYSPRW